jgi:hypothetical protein
MNPSATSQSISPTPAEAVRWEAVACAAHTTCGEFSPPADYTFETELLAPVPRATSGLARRSRTGLRHQWGWRAVVVFGVACVVVGLLPAVNEWSQFVLPLAFLSWLGVGVIVIGLLGSLDRTYASVPDRYLPEGVPLVVRVLELVKVPVKMHYGHSEHSFRALVEFRDPETGEHCCQECVSRDFRAGAKDAYTTSFKVGDYVTAVYLPGKSRSSPRLFAFLELLPGIGVVRCRPLWADLWKGLWKNLLLLAVLAGLFAISMWNIYAFRHYHPIDFDYRRAIWPMLTGGIAFAGFFRGRARLRRRRERRWIAEESTAAQARGEHFEVGFLPSWGSPGRRGFVKVLTFFGSIGFGALTALCWCFTVNAWLDDSPAEFRAAEIAERRIETRGGVFREYLVEYTLRDPLLKNTFSTTPAPWEVLMNRTAIAEVHAGRFG